MLLLSLQMQDLEISVRLFLPRRLAGLMGMHHLRVHDRPSQSVNLSFGHKRAILKSRPRPLAYDLKKSAHLKSGLLTLGGMDYKNGESLTSTNLILLIKSQFNEARDKKVTHCRSLNVDRNENLH